MKKLIIIPFLLFILTANAATYWVTPRGNNSNAGTDSSSTGAWLTWQKAFSTAVGHDTVYFRGGTYATTNVTGTGLSITNSGTAGNYVCFWAYQPDYEAGNYPTLDCALQGETGYNTSDGIRVYGKSYLHFKGLSVKNVVAEAICNGIAGWYITNVIFENCIVHDIMGCGFGIFDFYSVYITNCDTYDCGNTNSPTRPGDGGTGIAVVTGTATYKNSYAEVKGCRMWHCTDQGFSNGGGAGYVVVDSCWAWDNGELAGNLYGMGSGFKYSYIHSTSTLDSIVLVRNCIAASNLSMGFNGNDHYPYEGNYCTYNCFSYQNGDGWENLQYLNHIAEYGFMNYAPIAESPGFGRVWTNNLAYDNFSGAYVNYGGTVTQTTNSWNTPPGITVNAADFQSLDYTQLAGARQADGSLPVITFGKLSSVSQAINQGTDVGLPYDDTAPDLGWNEYTLPAPPTPPTVATSNPFNITSRYGTGAGIVTYDGGGTVSDRAICWGTSTDPLITGNHIHCGTGLGSFTGAITGLLPNTTYYVRAYATNGIPIYGANWVFTTDKWNYLYHGGKIVTHGGKPVIVR